MSRQLTCEQWYPTLHTKDGGTKSGAILGHESSGVVPAIGAEGRENGRGKLIIAVARIGATSKKGTTNR